MITTTNKHECTRIRFLPQEAQFRYTSGHKNLIIYFCILIFTFLFGCVPSAQKPLKICPGKASAAEALAQLRLQSQNMTPIFAKGNCSLLIDPQEPKQNLSIRVFLVKPPYEMFMQCDVGVVQKAVIIGSNEKEFWMAAKPNEIDSYWWGLWTEQDSSAGIMINPRTLLEALGIAEIDTNADWTLSNEGAFDILTKKEGGVTVKRIYIYCCEYRVRKIEYFDKDEQGIAVMELDNYKQVAEGFFVPTSIKISTFPNNAERATQNAERSGGEFNLSISLDTIRPANEKEKKFRIVRDPNPKGFKHIYKIINGRQVEQNQ